ncbi:MAG: type II toxin-antitoxin system RelE/ParE family toxin [Kiritimatiellae bacterium]|nr:type II toxin-antitoxin system RelE/ParE family toxin [Kiritimatiellia bacterium]
MRFLKPAEDEMLDAARYYELQAVGLGIDFIDKTDSAVESISANPEAWPVISDTTRRCLVYRFPYALLYRIDQDEIVIQATMHLRRHPPLLDKSPISSEVDFKVKNDTKPVCPSLHDGRSDTSGRTARWRRPLQL